MPLKEKTEPKPRLLHRVLFLSLPPALSVPCTLHTPGKQPRQHPLPRPQVWGGPIALPCPGGTTNTRPSPAAPARLLSPCSSLTYIPARTRAPLTFSLLLFQLSTNKTLLHAGGQHAARGGFIGSTGGQCSCKGGLCAPKGARRPPKANHSPGCLQTSSFTQGPPFPCP